MPVVFPWLTHSPAGLDSFRRHAHAMTHISPTWMTMNAAGEITLHEHLGVREIAEEHGLKVCPLIVNEGFRVDVADAILREPLKRRANADRLADLVEEQGWDGLNLDFEGPALRNRDHYTEFVSRISERLRPRGIELSIDVVGQTRAPHPVVAGDEADDHALWTDLHDYKALGKLVDRFVVMGYDYHSRLSPPGPVGPTWWLRAVLDWTVRQMPAEKLVLGLPLYGRQWAVQGLEQIIDVKSMLYPQVAELLAARGGDALYDWDAEAWQYRYVDAEGRSQILWFDDHHSLATRMRLVDEYGLAGVAFWCLGQEDVRVWPYVQALKNK